MLRIIWLQFKYSWKVWLGACVLFVISSILMGMSYTGLVSFAMANQAALGPHNPTPVFIFPAIFGLVTLFMVLSGVVRLVVQSLSREYQQWEILGANPRQLAFIIGGQVALAGAVSAALGYFISVPAVSYFYSWAQSLTGKSWLPDGHFTFSLLSFLITVLSMTIISGGAGFAHSYKLFANTRYEMINFKKSSNRHFSIIRLLILAISGFYLIMSYRSALTVTPIISKTIREGFYLAAIAQYVGPVMEILFWGIVFATAVIPIILPWAIKIWTIILPRKMFASINTAYRNTLFNRSYASSLIGPLFGGSFLLTGITYLTMTFPSGDSKDQFINAILSFAFYLGAPLIIILANVLTITIIVSKQHTADLNLMSLLGFTAAGALIERVWETIIYSVTFLIFSIVGNIPLYLTVKQIVFNTHNVRAMSFSSVLYWPIWLFAAMLVFIALVNVWRVWRFSRENTLTIG
ncbi:FtsX-like permease family protein [Lentilactobacillus sunkii]|jgi:hypothetical protein|uniref:FtsX-like permease family protein n=1 Tax=Lentilactobacillus sunkii TaxID=481719 RepID=A0A1E7XGZ1_9LACO|nr:hypothetical protein [Lentilactobacillus sunkii]OFA12309.1 FtsX-like permease family protein [Lentilactobacillus sunkii]